MSTRALSQKREEQGFLLRVIRYGLLVLVALMPFHAFLSVWLGSVFGGQLYFQAWKEVVVLILAGLTLALLLREPERARILLRPVNLAIFAFTALALIATIAARPPLVPLIAGLRYDIEPFVLLIIAQIAAGAWLVRKITITIVATGIIVGAVAALQAFFLPPDFMTRFGYGPDTILPFQLVDPAVQALRVPSTLGGPNQLGAYLLLPLSLGLILLWRRNVVIGAAVSLLSSIGIILSYSRAAWIGAVGAILALAVMSLSRARALLLLGAVVLLGAMGLASLSAIGTDSKLQYYVFHSRADGAFKKGSTGERLDAIDRSLNAALERPGGYGLGSAGPASFTAPNPVITENQYLQIALETGIFGLALYLLVFALAALGLYRARGLPLARALLASLIGVSLVNLFLHGWTDSTLAFVWMIAAGTVLGLRAHTPKEAV